MTPQRRESGVLSSGRKETAAMGGRDLHAAAAAQPPRRSIHNTTPHSSSNSSSRRSAQAFTELGPRRCGGIVDNIPAAAPTAPPPRRSTHKFIHFYLNTSLYGAWQKAYEGTDKMRIFIGCYREEEEALRAQDRACLKFKLPTEMLHYPEEDYVDDEELRQTLNHEEFAQLLRSESRNCYKTVAPSKCLKKLQLEKMMQSRSSAAGQLHSTDDHQPAPAARKSGTAPHDIRTCTLGAGIPMAAAGGFRLAAAAGAADQEDQQHYQLRIKTLGMMMTLPKAADQEDQQHYQLQDHFLDKLLKFIPRRKRSCKTKLQKVREIKTLGMMMTLPKAAATVASTLTTTVTKPQDSTKSCSRSNIMELQVHHQQSCFKSNTSLDLANKMNSLCIPTRSRSICKVRSCLKLDIIQLNYSFNRAKFETYV